MIYSYYSTVMDNAWRTAEWDWDSDEKELRANLLRYHPDRPAYAVQISRSKGDVTPEFNKDIHSCSIQAEADWEDWLDTVLGIQYNFCSA